MKNSQKLLIVLLTISNLNIISQVTTSSSNNDRVKWEAENKSTFNKISATEWSENNPNSNKGSFFYIENSKSDRGILLQDKNRVGVFIYLEKDKCQYKDLNNDWGILFYGSWVEGTNYSQMEEDEEFIIIEEDEIYSNNEMEEDEELIIEEDQIYQEQIALVIKKMLEKGFAETVEESITDFYFNLVQTDDPVKNREIKEQFQQQKLYAETHCRWCSAKLSNYRYVDEFGSLFDVDRVKSCRGKSIDFAYYTSNRKRFFEVYYFFFCSENCAVSKCKSDHGID